MQLRKKLGRLLLGLKKNDHLVVLGEDSVLTPCLTDVEKRRLLNLLMKEYFYAVNEEDLLAIRKGTKLSQIVLGGEPLPEMQTANLVGDARYFLASSLYPALKKSIRYLQAKAMYENSKVDADLVFGKGGMWWEDIFDRTITEISKIR